MPTTHNKNGSLNAYGFACGYIQWQSKTGKEVDKYQDGKDLYKDGAVYHVRKWENGVRITWESFDKLTDARTFYNKQVN